MGFRFIRKDSSAYAETMFALKEEKLQEEAKKWANISHHPDQVSDFIDRYHLVRQRQRTVIKEIDKLSAYIRGSHANLVSVQGNLDISSLRDLVE